MSLKEHLDELSYVLMELRDIDDKMENKDLTIILLASLPPSYENFVSSFSIGRDSITLEEVKSSFYFREFQLKAFRNVGEASVSRLSMTNSAKGQKKKNKGGKKSKANLKDIFNYCKESGHWK